MKPKKTAKASSEAEVTKGTPTSRARVDGKPGKPNNTSWHPAFLKALSGSGSVAAACRTAKVSRNAAYEHRAKFNDFGEQWAEMEDFGLDEVKAVLVDHAINGTLRPVFQQGCHVGDVREWDHGLGQWLLERKRPAEFGAKQKLELSGKLTMTDEQVEAASADTKESLLLTLAGGLAGRKVT
jgi:hypothetical protein